MVLFRLCRQIVKFVLILSMIILYLSSGYFLLLFLRDRWKRTARYTVLVQKASRIGLWILNVDVETENQNGGYLPKLPENVFVVSNHMTYLDILVISSQLPCCYITSMEIKETPVLGNITDIAGCLYIERRNKDNIENEIKDISNGLQEGLNVTIFPEATSTNGEEVIRFRRPLYNAAIFARKKIQPICINYESINGEPFSLKNRDLICWYGDMDFASHLWKLCGLDHTKVKVTALQPIDSPQDFEAGDLAQETHQRVSHRFKSCLDN